MDETWLLPDTGDHATLKKFAPDEMMRCEACLRANPPTRSQCMYCGAALQPAEELSTPESEAHVDHNKAGYYALFRADQRTAIDDSLVEQLATRFRLKPDELRVAVVTGTPLPLSTYSSSHDSSCAVNELRRMGLESCSVSDSDLNAIPYRNIRSFEFSDAGVTGISRNGRERWFMAWREISLIVTGRLFTHRLEIDEKRSRSSVKPLDRRELTQDRSVIDLYSKADEAPWRIAVNEFDFSCLGERKALTAFDNANLLIQFLIEQSDAELNDSYGRVKAVLANVWPLQSATKEGRSQRPRAGRNEISTVTASDNETQFNNYSRMIWCWLRQPPESLGEPVSA